MSIIVEIKKLSQDITLLYVEDNAKLRESLKTYLEKLFSDVRVASDGQEGLELFKQRRCDILISDILMPNMNGLEMIKAIKELEHKTHCIILSAYMQSNYFVESISIGVFSYIIKPVNFEQINKVLHKVLLLIKDEKKLQNYQNNLEKLVEKQVLSYKKLEEQRVKDYETMLLALIDMIERRDTYTAGHSERVATYCKYLATTLGCSKEDCELIYRAGILHDIGKIAIPDSILLKPGKLLASEYDIIKKHVKIGVDVLKKIPYFQPLIDIIISHHERYDGNGYPQGLSGNKIPPLARIMIVADAFDAMTTNRIYKGRKTVQEALVELEKNAKTQFHPEVVNAAKKVFAHIHVDENISQQPMNRLEEERFAYFYKDKVSGLYNHDYLSVVLLKNSYQHQYQALMIVALHNFKSYNDTFGWDNGNALLKSTADKLRTLYPDTLAFRIHANDFILLAKEAFTNKDALHVSLQTLEKDWIRVSIYEADLGLETIQSIESLEKFMLAQKHQLLLQQNLS